MRISRKTIFPLLLAFGLIALAGAADAAIQITVTKGAQGATPIAIVPFAWEGPVGQQPNTNVDGVVSADLARSGRFTSLPTDDMLEKPSTPQQIDFANWRAVNVNDVVIGRIQPNGNGGYTIDFRLFDVYTGRQLLGYRLPARAGALRQAAHRISNMIYKELTGERGAFGTHIVFVESQRTGKNTRYSLIVSDADGENAKTIAVSNGPILSPSWSPDGTRIAYSAFVNHHPGIYVQTLSTGQRVQVLKRAGLNSAPAFSPDGSRLAVVLSSQPGNPDIYILNLKTHKLRQITSDQAIETEPAWAPDGEHIFYTSDRGGSAQIYEQDLNGTSARRLTYDGSYNARPQVSPDGRTLAMVHRENGDLHIAVMNLQTGALRVLTDGELDKSPSFAPNGSMIIYAGVFDGKNELAAVSVDGSVHQQLTSEEGEISDPAWGPFPPSER
ncbi:MAG TPA: Tol-Pal system beta propeller repeat protein TolB [Gammaproteobacteria bacterium]|nr:Tol-Pal system beta propeller repeat protein TolB [Gammaproteobacteria bacterium]